MNDDNTDSQAPRKADRGGRLALLAFLGFLACQPWWKGRGRWLLPRAVQATIASGLLALSRKTQLARPVQTQLFRHKRLFEFITGQVEDLRAEATLDVGCGRGWFLELLITQGAAECSGCDWVNEVEVPGIAFRRCDLNQSRIPWPDETFSLVVCSDVIEHVESPSGLLRELHRVCRPNGHVFLTIPNIASVEQRAEFLVNGDSNRYRPRARGEHISMVPDRVLRLLVDGLFRVKAFSGDGLLWRSDTARRVAAPRGLRCNALHLTRAPVTPAFAFTLFYCLEKLL